MKKFILTCLCLAMAAGLAELEVLKDTPDLYPDLNAKGDWFFGELDTILQDAKIPYCLNHVGSLGCIFFTGERVIDYESAQTSDTAKFTEYFKYMLEHGIYVAPSQFEAMFLSTAHTEEDLKKTLETVRGFLG